MTAHGYNLPLKVSKFKKLISKTDNFKKIKSGKEEINFDKNINKAIQ